LNGNVLRNTHFTFAICPSSPLRAKRDAGGGKPITDAQYMGIMGATDGNGFVQPVNRHAACCACCGGQQATGRVSSGGMLVIHDAKKIGDAADGTTNVLIVGEHSNYIKDVNGAPVQVNGIHGIIMGTPNLVNVEDTGGGGFFERPFNMTTVAYSPNAPAINNDPAWPGIGDNYGSNNPLNSSHTGGVHGLLCDGSVRFIGNNVDMLTLRRLCTRDDGATVGDY
jgi:hypothetical protein